MVKSIPIISFRFRLRLTSRYMPGNHLIYLYAVDLQWITLHGELFPLDIYEISLPYIQWREGPEKYCHQNCSEGAVLGRTETFKKSTRRWRTDKPENIVTYICHLCGIWDAVRPCARQHFKSLIVNYKGLLARRFPDHLKPTVSSSYASLLKSIEWK